MTTWFRASATAAIFLFAASIGHADAVLSLSSSTSNLNSLHVGDMVEVTVSLSGLNSGDAVNALGADISFSSNLGNATPAAPGAIIPDNSAFFGNISGGSIGSGVYDALFSLSNAQITQNGVFFTFDLTAKTPGSGTISWYDAPSISGSNSTGGSLAVSADTESALSFAVVSAVPEPGAWCALAGMAVTFLAIARLAPLRRQLR
jgi:hypothetical protein